MRNDDGMEILSVLVIANANWSKRFCNCCNTCMFNTVVWGFRREPVYNLVLIAFVRAITHKFESSHNFYKTWSWLRISRTTDKERTKLVIGSSHILCKEEILVILKMLHWALSLSWRHHRKFLDLSHKYSHCAMQIIWATWISNGTVNCIIKIVE